MRPRTFDEFLGQEDVVGPGSPLRTALAAGHLPSIIFWGPPGSGKTTLARLLAEASGHAFVAFSAVLSGVKEVREIIAQAQIDLKSSGRRTILFVDEIHRFNKAQQDAFLPHVEAGTVLFFGATTENPSFEVNAALLSRCRVFVLKALGDADLEALLDRAGRDAERGLGGLRPLLAGDALAKVVRLSNGDGRMALTLLEAAAWSAPPGPDGRRTISPETVERLAQRRMSLYDSGGEEHYNLISALHKSLRGGDPDAALYWLLRMLDAGEDPLYLARRMVRFASEDVGCADSRALTVALAARDAVQFLGLPEADCALAQAAVFLALAPKSNAVYKAVGAVREALRTHAQDPVPLQIRNAPTDLMTELGYGKGYEYPHAFPDALVDQTYLPASIADLRFYEPTGRGAEKEFQERMERRAGFLKARRAARSSPPETAS